LYVVTRNDLPMTTTDALTIAPLDERTLPAAVALLETCGLPATDLPDPAVVLFGAFAGGALIATIGLEHRDGAGLLRSMAVVPDRRGSGLARTLYARAVSEARRRGLAEIYSLTTTADGFFTKLGFTLVDRSHAPEGIRATAQFSGLCPASTRLYVRPLDDA
jgi:amino-acid N-acetyltransferase